MNSNSPTSEIRKGKSVKASKIDCEYLTSDKDYLVRKVFIDGRFLIKDDTGENIFCQASQCGHLDGMDWIINK